MNVGDVTLKPALALGSWVAFKRVGGSAGEGMAMGDLVLTEAEVPGVLATRAPATSSAFELDTALASTLRRRGS